eukprot:UN00521
MDFDEKIQRMLLSVSILSTTLNILFISEDLQHLV